MISGLDHDALQKRLLKVIPALYAQGYTLFLCGGALGFDTLAAQAVLQCRERCPGMKLKMVLPCREQSRLWNKKDQAIYQELLQHADEAIWLSDAYYQGCMMMRNKYLVEHSSLCVCYYINKKGGTSFTVAYALYQDLNIINLALSEK